MGDDRQISAELQHNFHFIQLFISILENYWTDFHHLFTRCRAISVAINLRISKAMVREQRLKTININVCRKPPKLIGYHSKVPWTTVKMNVGFVIPIRTSTNAETVKIDPVVGEIFGEIGRFLPSHPKRCIYYPCNLWGYCTHFHCICTECS